MASIDRAAAALALLLLAGAAHAQTFPFLGDEARKRGIDLPEPFGVGVVYYYLDRSIDIQDVRVGRNGNTPQSVSNFAAFGAQARVNNANLKFDVWLLPFLNVYAIAGYIWNESQTTIDVTLPPLLPNGPPRQRTLTVPTSMTGTVGGIGVTVAGGYGPLFFAGDVNMAQANLGFDDRFHAVVTSVRAGWNGKAGGRPIRTWINATYWDTFAKATGTVADPDGGTLSFEVDQGPAHPWTFGVGAAYGVKKWLDVAIDAGGDFNGGYYVAVVPVFRF
ncbi:MAG TPA: hypothetical protein VFV19_07530 [Candidatus Polarisedimenticolaceae bacterium]|nr:hypothetical protein [Candidatus Polarisedimenticolaceae bacterium]